MLHEIDISYSVVHTWYERTALAEREVSVISQL